MKTNKKKQPLLVTLSILGFLLLIALGFTIVFLDKFEAMNPSKKYEKEFSGSNYEFFPNSLPDSAVNTEIFHFPGFWLARSKAYVKFEITEEYLDEYEWMYAQDAKEVTSIDVWSERHIENDKICESIKENFLNHDNCNIYVKAEGFSVQGYAINRDENEIFIFYDGFD